MFDPIRRVSAADIAGATVLAVVSIDAPSELNSRAGSTNGAMCLVTQNVAGINEWTLYAFDASSSGGVNSPYVLAASGSGQWIAFAGKYVNSAHLIAGAVTLAKSSGTSLTIASTNAASATTAGGYTSTVATGTAPFTATSTTVCPNLNAANLNGTTWTAPGAIGGGTPSTGAFTTISASGVITSTLATGTAPFTVASTTVVANLNATFLSGKTHADPGPIGSGTPSTGAFTTLTASSNAGIGGALSSLAVLQLGATNPLTGATQIGQFVSMSATSAATGALRGAQYSIATAAAAFTCAEATAFFCGSIALGAGSAITRATGAWVDPQSSGTNNCGLLVSGSLSYTGNWAIRSESTNASYLAGALQVAGALQLGNAYVATPTAGTGYVTIKDSTGTTYKVLVAT